jgi:predicted transcriptional regulator
MTNAHTLRKNVTKRRILQLIVENHALSIALIMNTLNLSYATVFRYLKLLSEEDVIEVYRQGSLIYAKIKENSETQRHINQRTQQSQ